MTATTTIQPATPTGEPDKRDRDLWLLGLLAIGPGDFDAARTLATDHLPRGLRGLATGDGFTFDQRRQLYVRTATGKPVSNRDVKRASLLLALAVAQQLEDDAEYVATGKSPIDLWQSQTADAVKDVNLAQAALAGGGFDRLNDELRTVAIGSRESAPGIAFNLSKLYDFAHDLASHAGNATTVPQVMNRAGLYAYASNGTYEEVRRKNHELVRDDKGRRLYLMERNILGEAEHCEECPALTAQGWVPMGTHPAPGSRACRMNCKCELQYSLAGDYFTPRA